MQAAALVFIVSLPLVGRDKGWGAEGTAEIDPKEGIGVAKRGP